MSVSTSFDLLLRGGRVIDPASGVDGLKDVAIRGGKVAAVQADILPTSAREIIDVTGKIVLPGLIDTHAHVYQYVTGRFGVNADMVGVRSGVTTLVDQGGPSCMTLPGFRHFIAEKSLSRTYAFLRPIWSAVWKVIIIRISTALIASISMRPSRRRTRTAIWCVASRRMPRSAASRAGASA